MSDATAQLADLNTHHIQGYTAGGPVDIPLISHIDGNLWMGGCIGGARLPDDFGFVLSLYPWEQYELGPDTERIEVRLYDSADVPDVDLLDQLAKRVNFESAARKTLVHCQAGLNRSGLITALALTQTGHTPAEAVGLLRQQRSPLVLCNHAFEAWLYR